ncbi:YceI family protein [Ulvibacterium marinum]|uniref:YceI family protein n=1 Tax=Ulvibacterium marinum TaxID=2419782 RepID=A0A3B0C6B2_9FLAO|nr:YceI family protein [Ulvibacterium marinum]RKN79734.1 YceI family protein [Ulvibacterium marinum]
MKKVVFLLIAMGFVSVLNAQKRFHVDTTNSIIKWTGSNLFKFNKHFGTVKFEKGNLVLKKDSIIGGDFEIDMNTIRNTDGKYNEMLVGHLKNEDFFDVEKYPKSRLEILKITYKDHSNLDIEARLTIKGITQPINYSSTLDQSGEQLIMKSQFIIDRTRWNVNYESKSLLHGLKDDIISDAIEFEVTVALKSDK